MRHPSDENNYFNQLSNRVSKLIRVEYTDKSNSLISHHFTTEIILLHRGVQRIFQYRSENNHFNQFSSRASKPIGVEFIGESHCKQYSKKLCILSGLNQSNSNITNLYHLQLLQFHKQRLISPSIMVFTCVISSEITWLIAFAVDSFSDGICVYIFF